MEEWKAGVPGPAAAKQRWVCWGRPPPLSHGAFAPKWDGCSE